MIVFDLKCGGGHVFEAWFASGAAFETQAESGQVRCPVCDNASITKAVMAPAVPAKGNRLGGMPPARIKAALRELAAEQGMALESSQWVGTAFAEEARAMHAGEREKATIHGQANLADAKALADEGVPIAPLPFPVVPPKALN